MDKGWDPGKPARGKYPESEYYTARRAWSKAYIDGLIRDGKITTAEKWAASRWPKELREDYKKAMDKAFGPPPPQWEPPKGSIYGSDPYLCFECADRDQKEVPAVIRVADISGSHHAGTDAIMVKTESGWEMTEPIEEYTIASIKEMALGDYGNKTGYCKDCWIHEYGNDGVVLGKKLFGAEDTPLLYDEEFYKSMATSNEYDGRLYCKECLNLGIETDPIVAELNTLYLGDLRTVIYEEDADRGLWTMNPPSGWANWGLVPNWTDINSDKEMLDELVWNAPVEGYCLRHWKETIAEDKRRTADRRAKSRAKYGIQPWNKEAEGQSKPPTNTPGNAVVLIDNSGSTASEDTGMTDRETGHPLNRLDRHVLTAAIYLGAFPDSGEYRIITTQPKNLSSNRGPIRSQVEDFDNTADAIDYLFKLTPSGPGFNFPNDKVAELTKDYHNVLLIQDEDISRGLQRNYP
tara:strand:+ start:1313 stop:2701 length:1389 start_codon:yes stop_codon:yes gene_type:complete